MATGMGCSFVNLGTTLVQPSHTHVDHSNQHGFTTYIEGFLVYNLKF